jgi:hypothetical protein
MTRTPPRRANVGRAAWVLVFFACRQARASDVSDELSLGALSSSRQRSAAPYVSDRVGGAYEPVDELALSADFAYTRYFKTRGQRAESIYSIAGAADYSPDDHFTFGVDVNGSPASTAVTSGAAGPVHSRTSLVGGALSAEYDTGDEHATEAVLDADGGVTSFWTTQRSRKEKKGTPSSLLQWRAALGATVLPRPDTELELDGAAYAYSTDPSGTGYFGASVFGRGGVSEGIPLEPLRWSLRPVVRKSFGVMKLGAFAQYGRYVGDLGWNVVLGLKTQIKPTSNVRLWLAVGYQRDIESTGERFSIPWASVGARVIL